MAENRGGDTFGDGGVSGRFFDRSLNGAGVNMESVKWTLLITRIF